MTDEETDKQPDRWKPADLITGQLVLSVIGLVFGVMLLLPANQGRDYVLFNAFRKLMPVYWWGLFGIVVSLLHFVGYKLRHKWLLVLACGSNAAFWTFVSISSLRADPTFPSGPTGLVYVTVYLVAGWRMGNWTN